MALPVFAFLIVAEVVFTSLQGGGVYALKAFAGSMSQLGINSVVRLGTGGALISLHFFLFQFRVFDVPNTVWGWIFTFVVIDFVFYWYHRAQHRGQDGHAQEHRSGGADGPCRNAAALLGPALLALVRPGAGRHRR